MEFPTKQAEISVLANQMVKGYQRHFTDFPHVNFVWLMIAHAQYRGALNQQIETRASVKRATADRRQKLQVLVRTMKQCLKKSQVDTKNDPKKMALIGFGPQRNETPTSPPNCPRNLRAVTQSPDQVKLRWDKPETGGPVENYLIESRKRLNGTFGPWQLSETSYDPEITLPNQPTGVRLEFRVVSSSKAGKSLPSNVVAVVL